MLQKSPANEKKQSLIVNLYFTRILVINQEHHHTMIKKHTLAYGGKQ
ncbi:hypothetical protein [Bacillus sp. B1-b2]|nr:hypothetical protein [Bacillus sp. B1-b2]